MLSRFDDGPSRLARREGGPSPTPVEALIPGVQGRVLGVLARTETEMTIRTAAGLAGASQQQASVVVAHLVDLGTVAGAKRVRRRL